MIKSVGHWQNVSSGRWSEEVALDGDVLGTRSILQNSKSAASDPGHEMEHPWYRRDTVAHCMDRPSERTTSNRTATKHLAGSGVAASQERMTSAI